MLAMQQLRATTKSLTFPPLSIARYSFIQLSEQGRQWRERKCSIVTLNIRALLYNRDFSTDVHCYIIVTFHRRALLYNRDFSTDVRCYIIVTFPQPCVVI